MPLCKVGKSNIVLDIQDFSSLNLPAPELGDIFFDLQRYVAPARFTKILDISQVGHEWFQ